MTGTSTHLTISPDGVDRSKLVVAESVGLWWVILVGALAGIGFTVVQIVEKIAILVDPTTTLACDVNSVMSCTNVLNAWQSSVLGPPNSAIGTVMFAVLASGGLAGVLRTRASRAYLLTLWGLAVFFLCFASWFMYETAFGIGNLCLWCTGIVTAVVVICASLTRLVQRDSALGTGSAGRALGTLVRSNSDLVVWAGWWLVIAALLWMGLSS
jgi:uncharacterized membrane protein